MMRSNCRAVKSLLFFILIVLLLVVLLFVDLLMSRLTDLLSVASLFCLSMFSRTGPIYWSYEDRTLI